MEEGVEWLVRNESGWKKEMSAEVTANRNANVGTSILTERGELMNVYFVGFFVTLIVAPIIMLLVDPNEDIPTVTMVSLCAASFWPAAILMCIPVGLSYAMKKSRR